MDAETESLLLDALGLSAHAVRRLKLTAGANEPAIVTAEVYVSDTVLRQVSKVLRERFDDAGGYTPVSTPADPEPPGAE